VKCVSVYLNSCILGKFDMCMQSSRVASPLTICNCIFWRRRRGHLIYNSVVCTDYKQYDI
jgi:hypothetical protein